MVQTRSQQLSLEEFLQLPETKPVSEYTGGQIVQKPMPQGKHSSIQGELVPAINAIVKPQRIGCAFLELRCTFGGRPACGGSAERSIVPDIAVFVTERIPRDPDGLME